TTQEQRTAQEPFRLRVLRANGRHDARRDNGITHREISGRVPHRRRRRRAGFERLLLVAAGFAFTAGSWGGLTSGSWTASSRSTYGAACSINHSFRFFPSAASREWSRRLNCGSRSMTTRPLAPRPMPIVTIQKSRYISPPRSPGGGFPVVAGYDRAVRGSPG